MISGAFAGSRLVVYRLSTKSSGGRTRTCDPTVNSRLLYQLSYAGKTPPKRRKKSYPGQFGVSTGWNYSWGARFAPSISGRQGRYRGLRTRPRETGLGPPLLRRVRVELPRPVPEVGRVGGTSGARGGGPGGRF